MALNVRTSIVFIYENYVDISAALTPSSELATLPATNIKFKSRTKCWRTNGFDTSNKEYITIDFGSVRSVAALGLVNHNLGTSGTANITLMGNASNTWGSPLYSEDFDLTEGYMTTPYTSAIVYDSNRLVKPPLLRILNQFFSTQSNYAYRYWRIKFNTKPSAGYVEIGKIFLCDAFIPSSNFIYGINHSLVDLSEIKSSSYGYLTANKKDIVQEFELEIKNLPDEEAYNSFLKMYYAVGQTEYFIMSLNPWYGFTKVQQTVYCRFTSELKKTMPGNNRNSFKISVREVL